MSCHENAKKQRFHGWTKPVLITTADIQTKVLIRFAHVPALVEHGFRLLGAHQKMIMDQHTGNLVPKTALVFK
jgi:hypothetical protein